jgi:hypothetical protein
MSPHEQNDDLGRLLNDAVSDIEPRSGIQAIRARTSAKESVMTTTRNWIFGAFGAAVATAAVITGVVVAGNNDPDADHNSDPAKSTSPSVTVPSEDPTDEPTDPATSEPPASGGAVPVYYIGDTPSGPRLYREFHVNNGSEDAVTYAVLKALDDPQDQDYRSGWPFSEKAPVVESTPDLITIDLYGDLHDLPAAMTAKQAGLAIQQLIYTAQAAYQHGRIPVQFMLNGGRTDQLLGQPASEPLANDPVLQTLSHVSLTTPTDGQTVSGTLEVSGVANSFEANVIVRLQRYEGTHIALQEPITAEGWMGEKLFPFEGSFDISDVEPGAYILMAMTDDPSGGAEGNGAFTDTKLIIIK